MEIHLSEQVFDWSWLWPVYIDKYLHMTTNVPKQFLWCTYAWVNYTITDLLSIRPYGTYFNNILFMFWNSKVFIQKMHMEMLSGKMAPILSWPQCVKQCFGLCWMFSQIQPRCCLILADWNTQILQETEPSEIRIIHDKRYQQISRVMI